MQTQTHHPVHPAEHRTLSPGDDQPPPRLPAEKSQPKTVVIAARIPTHEAEAFYAHCYTNELVPSRQVVALVRDYMDSVSRHV